MKKIKEKVKASLQKRKELNWLNSQQRVAIYDISNTTFGTRIYGFSILMPSKCQIMSQH